MEEKGGEKVLIYKHGPDDLGHQIRLDRKSRVEIKQNNQWWAFTRHSKEFEIHDQDTSVNMGKCGTQALKALFMAKRITSPCAAYSQKLK